MPMNSVSFAVVSFFTTLSCKKTLATNTGWFMVRSTKMNPFPPASPMP